MKQKNNRRSISDRGIVNLYATIIPLISHNPKSLNIPDQIDELIHAIIPHSFFGYYMETTDSHERTLDIDYETWGGIASQSKTTKLNLIAFGRKNQEERFSREVGRHFQAVIEGAAQRYGAAEKYDKVRFASNIQPRIVIEFFRRGAENKFTTEEIEKFKVLKSHVLSLFRAVLMPVHFPEKARFFDTLAGIGSRITNEYGLSNSETLLIPDILFGLSNEEIASRRFVSIATVRTHIRHILKKTNSKNRLDFVSKFFTTPERLQL